MEAVYIVGAGGIGCAVGQALSAAGTRAIFVDADARKVRWGRRVYLDQRSAPAEFVHFDDWRPEPGATVLLCTKCYDNAAVLQRLSAPTTLIPIQNGFDPLVEAHGNEMEGIASFVSECLPDRPCARLTRGGTLHLGWRVSETAGDEVPCDRTPLLKLAGLLQRHAPFRVRVVPRILPFKYTKLMYNAAINPLAALAGLDNGDLLRIGKARTLFFGLLRENYRILASNKVPLGKIGPFHPTTVHAILQRGVVAKLLAWFFYPTLRGSYCSMSADLPRGRTEIDYFNRHLIDLAGPLPCPLNRRVYDLIKSVESCRTPLGVHLLDQLA